MENWLNNKVDDVTVTTKYDIDEHTITPYKSHHEKDMYYTHNDTDIMAHEKGLYQMINDVTDEELENDPQLENLILYDDHILLCPNTNRYHANSLFRQLVDFSHDNDYVYDTYDTTTHKQTKFHLMNASMKESFYRFCCDNS